MAGGGRLAFRPRAGQPFSATTIPKRALREWASRFQCGCNVDAAGAELDRDALRVCPEHASQQMQPIGLHEARHTYASLMIAAGVNAKALSTFMGHSSIQITLDRYGHLMPGSEDEAAALFDAYVSARRVAEVPTR